MRSILICALFFLSTAAMGVENDHHESSLEKIEINKSPKEFKVPSGILDLILKNESGTSEPNVGETPILVWLPLKVQLSSPVEGILKNLNTEYSFSMGGGELDFSQIVVGDKGSFFIKFFFDEFKDLNKLKVFFYSRSKKRRVDGEIFGSGCNVYFDITKEFISLNLKQGIKVNATKDRHLSVMGGHFIIASKSEGKVFLTHLSFEDSNKPDYFCQEK